MKNLNDNSRDKGSKILALKQTNTVQGDKTSSNWNNGESNLPQDIENWIVASNIDLLSVMESFSPQKRRA